MDAIPVSKKVITFGSKQVFLPKFTIALTRTPTLSPYHARFLVPLNFSKFDLRDYLYHAYKVKCFNIRSYVKQQPVRDSLERPGHHFRPPSQKFMTVEMEKPFVWPAEPTSWEPWGKEEKEREIERGLKAQGVRTPEIMRAEQQALREQAVGLLKREKKAEEERETVKDGLDDEQTVRRERRERKAGTGRGGVTRALEEKWAAGRTESMLGRNRRGENMLEKNAEAEWMRGKAKEEMRMERS